jgi:PD-(D/E)XK nuclease superfamily
VKPTRLILDGFGDLNVQCEWKKIDVLAYSESQRLVVAIENKIDAKESSKDGESQLSRYADIIEAEPKFSEFSKLFLYLTVEGEEPTDVRWCTVMHEDVLGFVTEAYNDATHTGSMTTEAGFFVKNYIDFLRRNVVTSAELEEECKMIYQHHKELIDKIIEFAGASGGVSDLAEEFAADAGCIVYANRSGRFAYLPKQLVNAMPDGTLERAWWNQQKPVLFWFYLDDKKKLKLIFQVGPMKDKAVRNNLVNQLFIAFGREPNRRVTDQYTVITSEKTDADEESDLLGKMRQLHQKFEHKMPALNKLLSGFDFRATR